MRNQQMTKLKQQEIEQEREAFENYIKRTYRNDLYIKAEPDSGQYCHFMVRENWIGWRARAELAKEELIKRTKQKIKSTTTQGNVTAKI